VTPMRWEALFADMEAQLAAAQAAELAAQVADVTRAEQATVTLTDRLRAAAGSTATVRVAGGEQVVGTVLDLADQWLLLGDGPRRALVPTTAIDAVAGLAPAMQPDQGAVARRLGLGHALRALARDRATVRISTDGPELTGRVDRVGADHLDLALVDRPERTRTTRPAGTWVVPFAAIRVVRSG
jgi:hypothetical protein